MSVGKQRPRQGYARLNLTLPRELKGWLTGLSEKIKEGGGYLLPRNLIIRACLAAIKESGLDIDLRDMKVRKKGLPNIRLASSVEIEREFVRRIKAALKK